MHIPVSTPKYTVNREEMFVIETRDIVTKFVEETLAVDHSCTIVLATILLYTTNYTYPTGII